MKGVLFLLHADLLHHRSLWSPQPLDCYRSNVTQPTFWRSALDSMHSTGGMFEGLELNCVAAPHDLVIEAAHANRISLPETSMVAAARVLFIWLACFDLILDNVELSSIFCVGSVHVSMLTLKQTQLHSQPCTGREPDDEGCSKTK